MEKVIAKILADVGIGGIKDLKKMGSLGAIGVICKNQSKACVNMLYALESVIQGVELDRLPEKDKKELRKKYEKLLKDAKLPKKEVPLTTRSHRCPHLKRLV